MLGRARDHGIPANAVVVSIVDPEEEPIFEQDTDRIITLRFHDLDPQWPVDPERDPRPSYVFMNAEQARQIVDHVLKFHQHPEPWELLVNCMQGISRSGAVGTFVQRVAGIPAEPAPRTRARFRPRSKDGCKPFEHPEDCQRADGVRWNEVGGLWPGERKPAEPGSDQQGHRNEEKLAQLDADVERA